MNRFAILSEICLSCERRIKRFNSSVTKNRHIKQSHLNLKHAKYILRESYVLLFIINVNYSQG